MNADQIMAMLEHSSDCGKAVWDCPEQKRIIKTKNTYQPENYGPTQYKPQCIKCARIGQARCQSNGYSSFVTLDQAKAFLEARKTKRQELLEAYRQAREKEQADKEATWRANYLEYLQTPQWFAKRKAVLARDKHICQSCLTAAATQAHHTTYEHLFNEPLFELVSVCRTCHERLHE